MPGTDPNNRLQVCFAGPPGSCCEDAHATGPKKRKGRGAPPRQCRPALGQEKRVLPIPSHLTATCKLLEPQINPRNVKIVSNLTAAKKVTSN